jgi:hypothetical protein
MRWIYGTVAVVILISQTACAGSRVLQSPRSELAASREHRIWVTQTDGSEVVVASPRIRGDTIFGLDQAGREYSLALRHAETIKVRKVSVTRTAALGVALIATGIAIKFMAKGGQGPVQFVFTDCDKHPSSLACQPQ